MRYPLTVLTLLLSTSIASTPDFIYPDPNHYDLVQVDTGILDPLNSTLRMGFSSGPDAGILHGQAMAHIVDDTLTALKAKPVTGAQIPFTSYGSSYRVGLKMVRSYTPKVLGLSLSGKNPFEWEKKELQYLSDHDTIIVVPAGNIGPNDPPFYPASYKIECLVSVSQLRDGKRPYDYADGEMYVDEKPNYPRGTSSGAAIAEGLALRLRQEHPTEKCARIKARLLELSVARSCGQTCPISPGK